MARPKKWTGPKPFRTTTVPVSQTVQDIQVMLKTRGASATGFQHLRVGEEETVRLTFQLRGLIYRKDVPLGADTKDARQRMRALWWWLKAVLDMDEFDFLPLEETAMAATLVALPDGSTATVKDLVGRQIEAGEAPSLERVLALPAPARRRVTA